MLSAHKTCLTPGEWGTPTYMIYIIDPENWSYISYIQILNNENITKLDVCFSLPPKKWAWPQPENNQSQQYQVNLLDIGGSIFVIFGEAGVVYYFINI